MPLDDIVNVQITRQTQAIPEANFGIPLILGTNKAFVDYVRKYSTLSAVSNDFLPSQPEYIAAQAVFSQNPCPTSIFIGRRESDVATLNVTTGLFNKTYTTTVNDVDYSFNSSTLQQQATITMSASFVSLNLINVRVNQTVLGTITSVLTFSSDFNATSSIVATINGVPLAPVTWLTDQATTIGLLATAIDDAPGVASATAGTDKITVVFTSPGANTVDSVITSGTTPPTCTIVEGGFTFTNQATTMGLIRAAIAALTTTVATAVVTSADVITITSVAGELTEVNEVTVFLGASQPTATIVNDTINATVAKKFVELIEADPDSPVTAAYVSSPDATYTLTADVSGTPYTLEASTNITVPNACIVQITDVVPGQTYFVRLNNVQFDITTDTTIQTDQEIAAEFVALINAYLPDISIAATDNADGTFTLESSGTLTEDGFYVSVTPQVMSVIQGIRILPYQPTGDVATALTNIKNADNGWYAIACTDRTPATVLAIAAWTEAQTKIFGTASSNSVIINTAVGLDTTSIAAQLNNLGYVRTFCLYHQDASTEFPECAWLGRVLPETPGSETWKFKTLAGVATSNLTDSQSSTALAKQCNTYEYIGAVGITQNGTMAQGEFIDIIRGVDWLQSLIVQYVYSVLVNSPKVPYTDAGITSIQAQIKRALQQGIDNNFISNNPAPIVLVPKAANVASVDKANRILRNVSFQATLAGAIHVVNINGVVTV